MAKDAMAPRKEREREREPVVSLILSDLLLHSLLAAHSRPYFIDPIFYFLHAFGASRYFLHLGPIDPANLTPGHTKERIPSCVGGERYPRADGSRRQELTIDCCRQIVPHSARLTRYERERTISRRRAGEREGIHYSSKSSSTSSCCCSLCAISKVGDLSI